MGLLKNKTILIVIFLMILLFAGLSILVLSRNDQENIGILPTPTLTAEPAISPVLTPEFVPDQIIVKFKTGQSIDEIKDGNKKKELKNKLKNIGVVSEEKVFKNTDDPLLKNYYILKLKKGTDVLETKKILENLPEIESAEPDHIQRAL